MTVRARDEEGKKMESQKKQRARQMKDAADISDRGVTQTGVKHPGCTSWSDPGETRTCPEESQETNNS